MALVSTGQFTIVDQNDQKPITAVITANGPLFQTYTKDNGIETFNPNWASTAITLTANVFVGGVNVTSGATITGKQWSTTFNGSDLGTAVTQARNTNFTTPDTTSNQTYYFRCTYTDPVTRIESRVDASIVLGVVKVGSNAVYVQTEGIDLISESDTATKNVAVIKAKLVRSSGADGDNLQYKWYSIATNGTATQLWNGVAGVANYGIKSTPINNAPTGSAAELGAATFTTAGVTTSSSYTTAASPGYNTLVIGENAVTGFGMFKVEVKDTTDATVYVSYFTVRDVSDPYSMELISSAGDRLLQGLGNTSITPKVYRGATELASYTGWTFDWYLYDKNGARVGFVNSSSPPTPTIQRTVTANTTGGLTLSTAATLTAGQLIKLVSADGSVVKFAQVAATTTTAVTLQTATGDNALCNPVSATGLVANEFASGTMYLAESKRSTTGNAAITLTEHDVDGKNTLKVDANRP